MRLSKPILVLSLVVPVVFSPGPTSAQTDPDQTETRQALAKARQRVRDQRDKLGTIGAPAAELSALARMTAERVSENLNVTTRGLTPPDAPALFSNVSFSLDSVTIVKDSVGTEGVLLTGSKVLDYAKLFELNKAFEIQITNFQEQSRLQDELIDKLQATLSVKDAEVENLQLQNETERERAEIYKTMAELNEEGFFDKFMRRAALPIGLVVGLVVGASIN